MIMKNDKLQKGFTLVEALVAISILMVAVAAPLSSQILARISTLPETACAPSIMSSLSEGDVIITKGQLPNTLNFQLITPLSRFMIEHPSGPSAALPVERVEA